MQYQRASTQVYLFILFAELMRAYTSRSLRESLWKIGVFSNRWMQPSVGIGLVFGVLCAVIPGFNTVLGFAQCTGDDWLWVITAIIPCIFDEFLKYIYRRTGYGIRPLAKRGNIKDL